MKGILGRKVGMTQLLTESGDVVPVTVIEAGPCYVTQIKTPEKDGYTAIQLGFEETKPRRLTKGAGRPSAPPQRAICRRCAILREFRMQERRRLQRSARSCWPTSSPPASGWM